MTDLLAEPAARLDPSHGSRAVPNTVLPASRHREAVLRARELELI
jgi:hypothetical protein